MGDDLSPEARQTLLRLARRAIEASLKRESPPSQEASQELRQPRGAFVTLKRRSDGALRGCVGYVEARFPLAECVARAAVSAATLDGRFDSVTLEELPDLALDISALTPLCPIAPEDVQVGVHGLMIRLGSRAGLLLPQVAVEYGWDRETFLDHTCRKAGLPVGAWKRPEAELLGFSATVFGED
jgi:AmmeMemoRadiSam system protein A